MSKLAIQEALLPGADANERLAAAAELGISAVEFLAEDLDDRLYPKSTTRCKRMAQ